MQGKSAETARLRRERKTLAAMIRLHCRKLHRVRTDVCPDCRALLDYAMKRLDLCPFGADKPTCARCPVHCYKPEMRERVRAVMRFAGPRMTVRHPLLAVLHMADAAAPSRAARGGRSL